MWVTLARLLNFLLLRILICKMEIVLLRVFVIIRRNTCKVTGTLDELE